MKKSAFSLVAFMLAFAPMVFGGCGSTEPSRFYVLNSLGADMTGGRFVVSEEKITIGVGPVELPEYLDRPQIMTRKSPNQLELTEFERWAEPLRESFPRALAENLSVLLETDRILIFPWKKSAPIDYQVAVNVIRFDGKPGENASLAARWTLYGKGGEEILAQKKSTILESTSGEEYEALIAAKSRALQSLSREIASAIKNQSDIGKE